MSGHDFNWEQTDGQIVLTGPGARITFTRNGDRWTHRLAFAARPGDESLTDLVSAIETGPDHDDPARIVSPVYQELHRHESPDDQDKGLCLLLTGCLFQHHFSAALKFFRDPTDPEAVIIDLDVADRCRQPIASLAATYLVQLGSSQLEDAGHQSITWTGPEWGDRRLELQAEPPTTLALSEGGRSATRVQALAALAPNTFTQRLHYRWRFATSSGLTR